MTKHGRIVSIRNEIRLGCFYCYICCVRVVCIVSTSIELRLAFACPAVKFRFICFLFVPPGTNSV
jgi:hypothetical protein